MDTDVEDNLEYIANQKQNDEAAALSEQRKNRKDKVKSPFDMGEFVCSYTFCIDFVLVHFTVFFQVVMIGNGMGMFQIISSSGDDEGETALVVFRSFTLLIPKKSFA